MLIDPPIRVPCVPIVLALLQAVCICMPEGMLGTAYCTLQIYWYLTLYVLVYTSFCWICAMRQMRMCAMDCSEWGVVETLAA